MLNFRLHQHCEIIFALPEGSGTVLLRINTGDGTDWLQPKLCSLFVYCCVDLVFFSLIHFLVPVPVVPVPPPVPLPVSLIQ